MPVRGEKRGHAHQPAVDHDADALDREARLGDRRGEHDLACARRAGRQRRILRLLRQHPVERRHLDAGAETALRKQPGRPADLPGAGQEDEQIAFLLRERLYDHAGRRRLDAPVRRTGQIARLNREAAPLARHDRRPAEQLRHRFGFQGRRHDEQAQVLAKHALRLQAERQAEIRLQVPLVELVEDQQADVLERRVALQHPRQDTFRNDLDARLGAHLRVEPHPVADRGADGFAERPGHEPGGRTGGEAPGLEHDDLASVQPRGVQQGQRHPGRLTRSGRGDQNDAGMGRQRPVQLVQH
ncbi:hypothetical protein PM3016_5057 [Paenibacillus mucilaginosus 3016]|uniref:Uncharacterized protein n=1 Tax=Paenibacillus mucilaginosus 3016 TaxID=1116391 RepID=H6NP75_9BACL|nr:hypothetical protein PM3016_5057 [Paenibacillus mucilaginosus 3016]